MRIGFVARVAAVAAVGLLLWSIWDREIVQGWLERARPMPFFTAMAVLPALGVPLTPLLILAGATFGTLVGLIGSGLALALNLGGCYLLARGRLRPWLEGLLRRFEYELPDYTTGGGEGAFRFAVLVKLAPGVPAFVKNYTLGVAGVPFALYFGLSMLLTGSYAAVLVVLGDSVLDHDLGRAVPVLVAGAVLVAGVWWWRRRQGLR